MGQGTPQASDLRAVLQQNTGLDFARYADDQTALQALGGLIQQARQWRESHEQFQQIQPRWGEIREFLQRPPGQPQNTPAQPQTPPPAWQKPEYDPSWRQMIEPDGFGGVRVKPGYPPDVLHKLRAYEGWQQQTLQKLLDNPIETLKPALLELIGPMIAQANQQAIQGYQNQTVGKAIIDANRSWLYETDPFGRQQLTPQGKVYQHYVQQLYNQGWTDPQAAHQIAYNAAMGELARYQFIAQQRAQQQSAQGQPPPQNPAFAFANVAFGPAQQPQGPANNGQTFVMPPQPTGHGPVNRIQQFQSNGTENTHRTDPLPDRTTLQLMLQQEMMANGVTDDQVRASMVR